MCVDLALCLALEGHLTFPAFYDSCWTSEWSPDPLLSAVVPNGSVVSGHTSARGVLRSQRKKRGEAEEPFWFFQEEHTPEGADGTSCDVSP